MESECAAAVMWRAACAALDADDAVTGAAWGRLAAATPLDGVWHSLRNCVSYQAGVWQNLQERGMGAVAYPEAFQLALALRHAAADRGAALLADVLHGHSLKSEMQEYALNLLQEEPWQCTACNSQISSAAGEPAPLRDKLLFKDCELAVMAAPVQEYDAHAALVRAEYAQLSQDRYVELRVKILNQITQLPKLYHSPEFGCFESTARQNIQREINSLKGTAN